MSDPAMAGNETADVEFSAAGSFADEGTASGYIPLGYYVDFLRLLAENPRLFSVITYRDLLWEDEYDYAAGYPRERTRWQQALRSGRLARDRIYVLLQHDVDSNPERTMTVLRAEAALGIRSNVMIFNRRISRRRLQATGELVYTPYALDTELLASLQREEGFVVGYHSNAFEQSLFDTERALRIFAADVEALREKFDIAFFSAHGGTPGPDNLNNRDLPVPEPLRTSLRWVHNGHSPWFTATYSDGGINSPKRDPARRDLREFVRSWRPGGRYRVLTHPQYYSFPCGRSPRLSGTPWYEEVQDCYSREPPISAWGGLQSEVEWVIQTEAVIGKARLTGRGAVAVNRWLDRGRALLRRGARLAARWRGGENR